LADVPFVKEPRTSHDLQPIHAFEGLRGPHKCRDGQASPVMPVWASQQSGQIALPSKRKQLATMVQRRIVVHVFSSMAHLPCMRCFLKNAARCMVRVTHLPPRDLDGRIEGGPAQKKARSCPQ
jgi:hypothetical protein